MAPAIREVIPKLIPGGDQFINPTLSIAGNVAGAKLNEDEAPPKDEQSYAESIKYIKMKRAI